MQTKRFSELSVGTRFMFKETETRDDIDLEATYTVVEAKAPGYPNEARISLSRPRIHVAARTEVLVND